MNEVVDLKHTWESDQQKCVARAGARDSLRHRLRMAIWSGRVNGYDTTDDEKRLAELNAGYVTEGDADGEPGLERVYPVEPVSGLRPDELVYPDAGRRRGDLQGRAERAGVGPGVGASPEPGATGAGRGAGPGRVAAGAGGGGSDHGREEAGDRTGVAVAVWDD